MPCPNCGHPMNYVNLDKQNILHCSNCGASFFEENGINRLSLSSAKKLAADRKTEDLSGGEKLCPLDHTSLRPVESEAIPSHITLLKCGRCHGIFAFPDDLLVFKKAQSAKIEFFRTWKKPLPSIKTVALFSLTALILGTVIYRSNSFLNRFSQYTQASDMITKINFYQSGRYLMVFFKTNIPARSKIIFKDKTANLTTEKTINQSLATFHQLTTGDLNLENEVWYQIILVDKQGKETKTEIKKLLISN